jgi:hypothetical protein
MCIRPFRGTLIRLKAADLPIRERDFKKPADYSAGLVNIPLFFNDFAND